MKTNSTFWTWRYLCAVRWRSCLAGLILFLGMFLSTGILLAQTPVKVTGTVKDNSGNPLPAVGVKVKGGQGGTQTDINGAFSISVPDAGSTLIFSSLGFENYETSVGTNSVMSIVLKEENTSLNEVVVLGYGATVKKSDLTGAVSSVSQKEIQERQPLNLFDALQGKAAGVLIVNDGGGAPGAEGSIQVRGVSTLNGGSGPLYVVDGVLTNDAQNINPLDIESIEVLKDAASASIYGSRGSNGVIIITTKKGKEGKPRLDLQYTHLFGKLAHKLPQSNSAQVREFRRLQNPTNPNAGTLTDSLNPAFNADNDLQDLLLGNTAHRDQINFSLSGAEKKLQYYTSLNYQDDKSIVLNSYAKRIQSRVNISYNMTEKLKYTTNISLFWQKKNDIPIGRTVNVVFDRPAYSLIYYPDGSLTSYIASKRNPVANALYETNLTESLGAQINNQLDYQIFKDLKFTNTFNVNYDNDQYTFFAPRYVNSAQKQTNQGTNQMTKDLKWEFQSYLNYGKTFGTDHNVSATLGFSADNRRGDRFNLQSANSVSEATTVIFPSYVVISDTYTRASQNRSMNVFSRANYSYKGKYLLSGVFRRDGSSRFGEGTKFGNFYSGSAGWRFSEEPFMAWSKAFLQDGKLRASYGRVGNDRISSDPNLTGAGDYDYLTKVVFEGSYNGVGGAGNSDIFGNNFIQWETSIQKNIGLDLSFFKGRLEFTGEVYVKGNKDLLYRRDLPKETGFNYVTVNVGSIENKGLELSVSAVPVTKRDFSWNISGNITFERGKIKSLAGGIPFIAGNKWYIEEGGRIGNFFGWTNLGVYQWNESNAYNEDWQKLTVVLGEDGAPLYVDGKAQYTLNGQAYTGTVHSMYDPGGKLRGGDTEWQNMNQDSLIDDNDRHIIGNAQPDFYLGVYNNLQYKQFSLSFLFNASVGGQIYNSLQYSMNYPSNTGAGSIDMLTNSWRKPGDIAKYPYYPERANRGNQKANGNSAYLESSSFVRLASAKITYALDQKLADKIRFKGINAFVYGTNLLTWTNYRGYDPEFSTGNPLTPGDDTGRYPKRREIGLGLNLSF